MEYQADILTLYQEVPDTDHINLYQPDTCLIWPGGGCSELYQPDTSLIRSDLLVPAPYQGFGALSKSPNPAVGAASGAQCLLVLPGWEWPHVLASCELNA